MSLAWQVCFYRGVEMSTFGIKIGHFNPADTIEFTLCYRGLKCPPSIVGPVIRKNNFVNRLCSFLYQSAEYTDTIILYIVIEYIYIYI